MPKPPKMADIAKAVGVSPMTVSRAFRRDTSVGEATREKILQIAEEMGYVFDSTASNLRSQRTGFVAVTIPSLNNSNFADTVRGLNEILQTAGLQLLLGYTNYDVDEEERLIEQLLRRRPEAMVVTGGCHTDRARRLLVSSGIPVVETWDIPRSPVGYTVGFSNADAMGRMVEHLQSAGAQHLAFIGGDDKGDTRGADRRRGFVAAARRLRLDYQLIPLGSPPVSMREGVRAMAEIFEARQPIDAVVCVSDLAAFGALTECQRRGVSVPDEIMIAGFGAYDIADVALPGLTTIDVHSLAIGNRTGELLVALLRGGTDVAAAQTILHIEPTLRISGSTVSR
ncbi:MAG: LacI family DNA-binding transcriptional regulator [Paracoccaceae bacterium]|nr:LacI family DNA-binding transcriptional regulator [Paracoccaceae bacterium]